MNRFVAALLCASISSPAFAAISRDELKKALDANPDLVIGALKKADRIALFELMMDAQRAYQEKRQKEEEAKEKADLEAAYKNPFKPAIDEKTRIRGEKNAPITIVEYSDFQCPFCSRAYQTVEILRQKYGPRMRFVYKHLPLYTIHPMAMPAAKWHEAIALQSPEKAWLFHDKMFQNQSLLGEEYFKATAKELGVNVEKAAKDAQGAAVSDKIEADMKEARDFGFSGTPGFLINGIPMRALYPPDDFDKIVARLGL